MDKGGFEMKLLFASDIHGSSSYAKKVVEKFEETKSDQLILLGDVMYHGPRNPLPKEYNPQKVSQILNQYKNKIIAVRGNCDSEVDQMLLQFPMLADYTILYVDGIRFFVTHGHLFDEDNLPNLSSQDVLIYGHYHLPIAKKKDDIYILNPSSVSLPKEGTNSYGIYENKVFTIYDFDGNIVNWIRIGEEQ